MSPEIINDSRYAYRVAFVERLANRPRTADQVIEFVRPDSAEGKAISRVLIKETERKKFKPHQIVQMMQTEGYPRFLIHHHINLWKERSARPSPFGVFLK